MNGPLRVVVFADAGFNTSEKEADIDIAQIGYLVLLVDSNKNCNVLAYSSKRCKRVTRSVLAAELFALVTIALQWRSNCESQFATDPGCADRALDCN